MRLWSLHPSYLDKQALQVCWADALQALEYYKQERAYMKGITNDLSPYFYPCLDRFRMTGSPIAHITNYLHGLCDESERRNTPFGRAKLPEFTPGLRLKVTDGQIAREEKLLLLQLNRRKQTQLWMDLFVAEYVQPHPLFEIVSGPVEPWETSS